MATPPLKDLYVGASGVIWALDALRQRGLAETSIDLAAAAARTLEAWRELPDYAQWDPVPDAAASALLTGESGPLIVAWRLAPSSELADELYARVRENVGNEAVEIMFGAPGTMLAAQAMLEWTGEERWADAWRESAESVWAARDDDGLWTNRLYGETFRSLDGSARSRRDRARSRSRIRAESSSSARPPRRSPASPCARTGSRTGRRGR